MTRPLRETIVCVASGASLTQSDVDRCRGKARVLVVNDNYRLAPWADWIYACDGIWWDYHVDAVHASFAGECWTRDARAAGQYGLRWIESAPSAGLSRDPKLIHEGCNSGYQAINLAYHFGARRIVLLGYDMGGTHWFGDHPQQIRRRSDYAACLAAFPALADDLADAGVKVVNCTRKTALDAFPRATIDEVL